MQLESSRCYSTLQTRNHNIYLGYLLIHICPLPAQQTPPEQGRQLHGAALSSTQSPAALWLLVQLTLVLGL